MQDHARLPVVMRVTLRGSAAAAILALAAGAARAQPPTNYTVPDPPAPAQAPTTRPASSPVSLHMSSEVAGYADSDHVFVLSPTIAGTVSNPLSGWALSGRYLVDIVSAASVDIVSTASRRWEEVRQVGSLDASYKPGSFGVAASASVSSEPDYQSYMGGGAITQDVLAKRATLLLGYYHTHDIAGRGNTPFSVFSRVLDIDSLKVGSTFVLDRATLLSVVGDVILEHGDPSKPYRYVPMFAPGTNVPLGASVDLVTQLRLSARVLEQLPLTRDRYALSGRLARRFSRSTLRLDERAYLDTWGLKASTTDLRWLVDTDRRVQIGPHVRLHAQSAVDFWQRGYTMDPAFNFPALRTGDRELGPLLNFTGGGSLRWAVGSQVQPRAWIVGFDLNLTHTQYLDDIYLTQRFSAIGALSLEAEL